MKNQKIHDIIYHKEDPRKREMPCDNAGAARSAQECARSIIYHKEDPRKREMPCDNAGAARSA